MPLSNKAELPKERPSAITPCCLCVQFAADDLWYIYTWIQVWMHINIRCKLDHHGIYHDKEEAILHICIFIQCPFSEFLNAALLRWMG